ncbi:MAG: nucleoside deaminase [Cyanobacteria bacterium REEB65]|nr:nucleoside deaminase [Cyanobacteria bacterium REEB65]
MTHADWMALALEEAQAALDRGEVPVGAVITYNGEAIARAGNTRERAADPLGHAELTALRAAANELGRWRLAGCTLYSTLEPCPMCTAAALQARVDAVVFGAYDPKLGACGSVFSLVQAPEWNHHLEVIGGVCEDRAADLLRRFFSARRK